MTRLAVSLLAAFAALSLSASPAYAEKKPVAKGKAKPAVAKIVEPAIPAMCPLPGGETPVRLQTSVGSIDLALDAVKAPLTSANMLKYVDQKRMDGAIFYRSLRMGNDPAKLDGLIQAGQRDPAKLLPPVTHEPTSLTKLSHKRGAISMARGAPGSALSDFFVMVSDMTGLDADPAKPGDNQGYAVFGHVLNGMDLVERIFAMPIDPAKGPMVGQMIAAPVTITTARRIPLLKADNPQCAAKVTATL